jgi:hypothetical protein
LSLRNWASNRSISGDDATAGCVVAVVAAGLVAGEGSAMTQAGARAAIPESANTARKPTGGGGLAARPGRFIFRACQEDRMQSPFRFIGQPA